mmetsp:Transcript_29361/g.49385  ORF Transcript_29361/g.49385 Transcript_29361/m.49385 type:complete len:89 (-) Transcript_29361:996-1262(-)
MNVHMKRSNQNTKRGKPLPLLPPMLSEPPPFGSGPRSSRGLGTWLRGVKWERDVLSLRYESLSLKTCSSTCWGAGVVVEREEGIWDLR